MTEGSVELPDAAARSVIMTALDRNLFVEAGAGSGKTTSLVRRIVNPVLSTGENPMAAMMLMMGPGGGGKTKKWSYDGARYDWDFGDNAPGVSNVNRPSADAVEEAVKLAEQLEGAADILWIRDGRHVPGSTVSGSMHRQHVPAFPV